MSKFSLLIAGGAGYVLGTRAGRERYEQIRAGAQRIARNPKVQEAGHKAQDAAAQQASAAAAVAKEKANQAASAVNDKVRSGDTSVQSTP